MNSSERTIFLMRKLLTVAVVAAVAVSCAGYAAAPPVIGLPLSRGQLADYGASPWYTPIQIGNRTLPLALDSGADFFWVTSDLCTTPACNAHQKVDTTPGSGNPFAWVDKNPSQRDFGPWGTMTTYTGENTVIVGPITLYEPFFASINYEGAKFQTLAWAGGVGFPSNSAGVTPGSSFLIHDLWRLGAIPAAQFSIWANPDAGVGAFILGGEDSTKFVPGFSVVLPPYKNPPFSDIWATSLHFLEVGNQDIVQLTNTPFWLDSGSSHFKGDGQYVWPILTELLRYTDAHGQPIFSKVFENGEWTGLIYNNPMGPYAYPNLPTITLAMGECQGDPNQEAVLVLNPYQYSYFVQTGDRNGNWVVAIHVLDDVGGLLVGSQLQDLIYTTFNYNVAPDNTFTQGNMIMRMKAPGTGERLSIACEPATIKYTLK